MNPYLISALNLKEISDHFESCPIDAFEFNYDSNVGGWLKSDEAMDTLSTPSFFRKSADNAVLGKVSGVYFSVDGVSVNGRKYIPLLWTNTLSNKGVQERLNNGMDGMYEHPKSLEFYTKDGIPTGSHPIYTGCITKKLYISNRSGRDLGMGESYIVDTPVGRIIDVLLRARDENGNLIKKLYKSARAWSREAGRTKEGYEILDPRNYYLHTMDIVGSGGVKSAVVEYSPRNESTSLLNDEFISNLVQDVCENGRCRSKFLNSYEPKSKYLRGLLRIHTTKN